MTLFPRLIDIPNDQFDEGHNDYKKHSSYDDEMQPGKIT